MFILSSFFFSGLILLICNLVYDVCQPPARDQFYFTMLEHRAESSHAPFFIQTTQKRRKTTYLVIF